MPENSRHTQISAFFIALVILLSSTAAYAHKVSVFAYVEGSEIFTESYFRKDKRVHEGKIEVFNLKTGAQILTGTTDNDGNFNFPVPKGLDAERAGLKIVLIASEGHRNDWTLTFEDIFPQDSTSEISQTEQTPQVQVAEKIAAKKTSSNITNSDLSNIKTQLNDLNSKIETLKRLILNQQEDGPGMMEIFAGIGYIFGFFGIAAFISSRKK